MKTSSLTCGLTRDGQRYALPLAQVERLIHAVGIIPLPKALEIIAGVINVRGAEKDRFQAGGGMISEPLLRAGHGKL